MRYKNGLGVAFDIGTTTVAGALVDLEDLSVVGRSLAPNPQARWGRDVLSRINALCKDPGLLAELKESVTEACNGIIERLAGDKRGEIRQVTVAGNPVMEHIFLSISPGPLSRVPYKPAFKDAKTAPASELGIEAGPGASLYAFPLIGGFVGGDAVAVALALGIKGEEAALAIDIGTNSEILLSCNGAIYAASAAAGPAFEGGELKYGMVAQEGAIQGLEVEGDRVRLDVIGGVSARGICGSGLIEAASALIKAGVIERSGRIMDAEEVPNNLSARIKKEEGGNSFVLFRGPKGEVTLTQSDVRALQTAKSATRAGIEMLLRKAKVSPAGVKKVYIAGAFGSHLEKEGLSTIGLLDPAWEDVRTVGDAALEGAVLGLNEKGKKEAEALAREAKYVSLSGSRGFEREFLRHMNF